MSVVEEPELLRESIAVAGDWLAVGLDPRPERFAAFPWRRASAPTLPSLVAELVDQGVRRFVLAHGGSGAGPGPAGRPDPGPRHRPVRGRRGARPGRDRPAARCRRARHHSGRGAPVRGDRLPRRARGRRLMPPPPFVRTPALAARSPTACAVACWLLAADLGVRGRLHRPGRPAGGDEHAPAAGRGHELPDEPAGGPRAGPDPDRHDHDAEGHDRDRGRRADTAPIATGNFVALAGCGYYDGVVFSRLVPGLRDPGRRRPVRPGGSRRQAVGGRRRAGRLGRSGLHDRR